MTPRPFDSDPRLPIQPCTMQRDAVTSARPESPAAVVSARVVPGLIAGLFLALLIL